MTKAPRIPGRNIEDVGVPEGPAAYCWWDGETPLYVGAAENLRHQLLEVDFRSGRRPVPDCRKRARERLQLLGRWTPGAATSARRSAITRFLRSCSVCWRAADSAEQAQEWAEHARQDLWGDAGWQARPGEDRWLACYLNQLGDAAGLVVVEVPIAGGPESKVRRIDAVRFPELETKTRTFQSAAFGRALKSVTMIEIIEVKRTLNRTVIGRLLIARDLGPREWDLQASCRIDLVALVTAGDTVLEDFCRRSGIRVETVDRDCAHDVKDDEEGS